MKEKDQRRDGFICGSPVDETDGCVSLELGLVSVVLMLGVDFGIMPFLSLCFPFTCVSFYCVRGQWMLFPRAPRSNQSD